MKPLSERGGRGIPIEVLRWLCVVPAAVLGDRVAQYVVGSARNRPRRRADIRGDSIIACPLTLILFNVAPRSAFVIAGAKMAPRYQRATAVMLTVLGFYFSLMTHVISQQRAGRRIGFHNYSHLFAETAGGLGVTAYILWEVWRNQPTAKRE